MQLKTQLIKKGLCYKKALHQYFTASIFLLDSYLRHQNALFGAVVEASMELIVIDCEIYKTF